jgi:RNA polymerase sigma factor (sigma-70 family)
MSTKCADVAIEDTGKFLDQLEKLDKPKKLERTVLERAGGFPPQTLTPEEIFRIEEAKKEIDKILLTLSPREQLVIRRHIMDGETLEEIGQDLHIDRSRVGHITAKALQRLRDPRNSRKLQKFIN